MTIDPTKEARVKHAAFRLHAALLELTVAWADADPSGLQWRDSYPFTESAEEVREQVAWWVEVQWGGLHLASAPNRGVMTFDEYGASPKQAWERIEGLHQPRSAPVAEESPASPTHPSGFCWQPTCEAKTTRSVSVIAPLGAARENPVQPSCSAHLLTLVEAFIGYGWSVVVL